MGANTKQLQPPSGVDGEVMQVLAPVETTVVQVVIGATNQAAALPPGSELVEVACSDYCYFSFGTSAIDATSGTHRLLAPGVYVYNVPYSANQTLCTHFAATRVGAASGFCTVARMV